MIRKIIHIDMDAFYASVEQRDNPKLKGKPIIVGGSPDERGVASTASYEARKFGVKSAMATKYALKLCPELIIVKPNFNKYIKISRILYGFYKEYTDLVEPLSLDECYLDVTVNKKGIPSATQIAIELKNRIKKELQLTASVGVAPNMFLAKIASDLKKPDGLFIIKPNQINDFIKDLEINKIWGVGKVTAKKMEKMNIKTCSDLQKLSLLELADKFGVFGETLYNFARGIDERLVEPSHDIKSIAGEITFKKDTRDIEHIKKALYSQAQRVNKRLINYGIKCKTISIKIKYADFHVITRSETLLYFTNDIGEIYKIACGLLNKTEVGLKDVRLVGISAYNLDTIEIYTKQLDLKFD